MDTSKKPGDTHRQAKPGTFVVEIHEKGQITRLEHQVSCHLNADRIATLESSIGGKQVFWGLMVDQISPSQIANFAKSDFGQGLQAEMKSRTINPAAATFEGMRLVEFSHAQSLETTIRKLVSEVPESSVIFAKCISPQVVDSAMFWLDAENTYSQMA